MSADFSSILPNPTPSQYFEIWAAAPEGCVAKMCAQTLLKTSKFYGDLKNNEVSVPSQNIDQEVMGGNNKIHKVFYMRLKPLLMETISLAYPKLLKENLDPIVSSSLHETLQETRLFDEVRDEIKEAWKNNVSLTSQDHAPFTSAYFTLLVIANKDKYADLSTRDWEKISTKLLNLEPAETLLSEKATELFDTLYSIIESSLSLETKQILPVIFNQSIVAYRFPSS